MNAEGVGPLPHGNDSVDALGPSVAPLVRAYLDQRGMPSEDLPGGVIVAPLSGRHFDAAWQMWFATSGAHRDWLVVQVRASHRVPRERWPDAIRACNAWNASGPLSKAWLAVDDWRTAPDGGLVLETSLPLDNSVGQDVVDSFLDAVGRDALGFWRALIAPRGRERAR